MTTLMVLMNGHGAALAADSVATTVDMQTGKIKPHSGVRKLFQLTGQSSVAGMIYQNASILDVPWHALFDQYSGARGGATFDSVEAYADDFFAYIGSRRELLDPSAQKRNFLVCALSDFHIVLESAAARRTALERAGKKIALSEAIRLSANDVFNNITLTEDDEDRPYLPDFGPGAAKAVQAAYGTDIQTIIDKLFGKFGCDKSTLNRLNDIAVQGAIREFFPETRPYTGVVFAGYGKTQLQPELCHYRVGGVLLDKIRKAPVERWAIGGRMPVVIQPFADDRTIQTILTGIDPYFLHFLLDQSVGLIHQLSEKFLEALPKLTPEQAKELQTNFDQDELLEVFGNFLRNILLYGRKIHFEPIMSMVFGMTPNELASTVEMLVKVNAFQQEISVAQATVGGEIDVAVLTTKGFHWVKQQSPPAHQSV